VQLVAANVANRDAQEMTAPPRPLRVLVADDHPLIRHSFREDLEAARIVVCGEAATGAEAVRVALAERPDLCLLDVRMPEGDGITAAGSIRRSLPTVKIGAKTSPGGACRTSSTLSRRVKLPIRGGCCIRCCARFRALGAQEPERPEHHRALAGIPAAAKAWTSRRSALIRPALTALMLRGKANKN